MTLWTAAGHPVFSRHRIIQLALAAHLAHEFHPPLVLFTDPKGAETIYDFGLSRPGVGPFDEVDTEVLPNRLKCDSRIWALGKLAAYEALAKRGAAFVHVDGDAFLFRPLPDRIQRSRIFAQSPEKFYTNDGPGADRQHFRWVYTIREMFHHLPEISPEMRRLLTRPCQTAVNMGCFGGNDAALIEYYAGQALRLFADSAPNQQALGRLFKEIDPFFFTVVVEQWMIGPALLKFRTGIDYLMDLFDPVHFSSQAAAHAHGYVHLWGQMKDEQYNIAWTDEQLRTRAPKLYDRIDRVCVERGYLDRPSGGFRAMSYA